MTSRRIEGYKDYYDVLKKHERSGKRKRLARLVLLLLVFLSLLAFAYYLLPVLDHNMQNTAVDITKEKPRTSAFNGPKVGPDHFNLNIKDNGKT